MQELDIPVVMGKKQTSKQQHISATSFACLLQCKYVDTAPKKTLSTIHQLNTMLATGIDDPTL